MSKRRSALADSYRDHRARAAARSADEARAGQDIGDIPPVANPKRRKRCSRSLKLFFETYFPHKYFLPWSKEHLRWIRSAERVVRRGGQKAEAMPRGYGKTTMCEDAVLWGMLYGYQDFPFFVGAIPAKGEESLDAIKGELETNDLLLEDFPEVCYPCRCLEGISNRAKGQRFQGKRTYIRWTNDTIVLPTISGSAASGAVIRIAGITGALRGQKYNPPGGARPKRPSIVFIDDPQTRESAKSHEQVRDRLRIINGDVLKLGGPGRKIAALAAVTIIEPDDVADQLTDRKRNPDWQGERVPMLKSLPSRLDLWQEDYDRLRRISLDEKGDLSLATAFYRKHRREMDKGAEATWPHYHEPDEISNIQHAMNWYLKSPEAFWSECQNQPAPLDKLSADALKATALVARVNGRPRGEVPGEATRLVAYVDVQKKLLPWLVVAWADDFTGWVVDYGTWPDQRRAWWSAADAQRTLGRAFPEAGFEATIYQGLQALAAELLGREWKRDDGGVMRIGRCLIDANWGDSTDVVYQFCRESAFSALLIPSHGQYIGAGSKPWHEYKKQSGERLGHHWRVPKSDGRRPVRHMLIDTNWWKSFAQARLSTAVGDRGALMLFGKAGDHELLAEHLTSERGDETTKRGRTLVEWTVKPNRENHLWDCLVGCCAAASYEGCRMVGAQARPHGRRTYRLSEARK
jgi:hypothetical protein